VCNMKVKGKTTDAWCGRQTNVIQSRRGLGLGHRWRHYVLLSFRIFVTENYGTYSLICEMNLATELQSVWTSCTKVWTKGLVHTGKTTGKGTTKFWYFASKMQDLVHPDTFHGLVVLGLSVAKVHSTWLAQNTLCASFCLGRVRESD